MLDTLHRLDALRGTTSPSREPLFAARLVALKAWQRARLARTYADLAAVPRFAPAVDFFLDELYGGKDSAMRDRDLVRMYPTMKRLLPRSSFELLTEALELDVLSEEFDQSLTLILDGDDISETTYAHAFREAGRRADRERQVVLMHDVGRGLDRMVGTPLLYTTLKLLRGPARAAGLGGMQQFLEAGFSAFGHMKGADYFLDTIAMREGRFIERLMDGRDDAFEVSNLRVER